MRATLEILFREHVFLLGSATENLITGQRKPLEGAANALEENTLSLADQFDRIYATRGEQGFLAAWRPYTDLMTAYAGRLTRKQKIGNVEPVLRGLAGKTGSFAAEISALNNARIMTTLMGSLITSVRAAIDAQFAKDFKKAGVALRAAADRAAELATAFARTFADDLPAIYPGDPRSGSSALRASLTAPLVDHVYLVGLTTENILTRQSKPRDGAKAALDSATASLAEVMSTIYGAGSEAGLHGIWREQGDLLISYANAAQDDAKRAQLTTALEQYATDAAAYLSGLNPRLDRPGVERIVRDHGRAMTKAIDALAAGDHIQAGLRLRAAAERVGILAATLATAAVERFPGRFRPTPGGF